MSSTVQLNDVRCISPLPVESAGKCEVREMPSDEESVDELPESDDESERFTCSVSDSAVQEVSWPDGTTQCELHAGEPAIILFTDKG